MCFADAVAANELCRPFRYAQRDCRKSNQAVARWVRRAPGGVTHSRKMSSVAGRR
jgi:hypothetical protein